jgi:hypothetical protein
MLKAKNMPKFILAIDWETTGTTWSTHQETFKQFQGISFGAIVADAKTLEPVEQIYHKVKFDSSKYKWSAEAEAIHGISQQQLEQEGLEPEEAAAELAEMILKYFGTNEVMFLGHNTWFDIHATKQLLEPFGVMPKLHHVVLDTAPLGFIGVGSYKSNDVFNFFCGDRAEKHNALDDANMCLTSARCIRQLCQIGLGDL